MSVLGAWRTAVEPYVRNRGPVTVLDLGSGTGIFTRAWSEWFESRVLAMEPSDAMRSESRALGLPPHASIMGGSAEALGIVSESIDVAWLSTVLHHVRDRPACADELKRVVRPGGALLIRGMFAELGTVGWLPFFPGSARARNGFPSLARTTELFESNGFKAQDAREVDTGETITVASTLTWVKQMRAADTLLGSFNDDEYQMGIAALMREPPERPLITNLVLAAFTREGANRRSS